MLDSLSSLGTAAALIVAARGAMAVPLAAYNVDPASVSVSGLSSGGFMASQLGVAYSSVFQTGFGVFAAGPYDCARNQYYTSCMYNSVPSIATPLANMQSWSGNQIDSVANLANRRIYMEVGTADPTIGLNPMYQLRDQLASFANPASTSFITTAGAGHTFPTNFDATGNSPCSAGSQSPYISNCGYDGAGAVLKWMYGAGLAARNDGALTGQVVEYDQTGTLTAGGMGSKGYVYVPAGCKNGATVCKLHVALHGCQQSDSNIGRKYVDNTGYNKWADTNNIIILYPQTKPDYFPKVIWGGTLLPNPNACWDWVGWYGQNADQKGGAHMSAIVNQVNRVLGS